MKVANPVMSILNFGSFPGKILFTAGYTYAEICKELKKQRCLEWLQCFETTKELWGERTRGFGAERRLEIKGSTYFYHFICLRDRFDFSDKAHITLAHEILHICSYHLSDLIDLVRENEAFAYTHSHIMEQCYKLLRGEK